MSYIDVVDRNLPTTVVIMSSADVPEGKFSGSRAFQSLAANLVFVNCPHNSWFISAVPGLGDTLLAATTALRNILDGLKASKKVVFYGGSMGGYGAFLYGALTGADWTIATGVEVMLGMKGGYFNRKSSQASGSAEIPDLVEIVKSASGKFVLIAGEESSIDLRGAVKLLPAKNVVTKTIVNGEHTVPHFLNKEIGIVNIIENIIENGSYRLLDFYCGKVLSYPGYANLLYRFDVDTISHDAFLQSCEKYLDQLDPISLSYYLYRAGMSFKRRGKTQLSFNYLRAAHHQNGANSKIIVLLAQAYFGMGEFESSKFYAMRAIDLADPHVGKPNYVAYLTLSEACSQLGEIDMANETLSQLATIAPRSGPIRERLNVLMSE